MRVTIKHILAAIGLAVSFATPLAADPRRDAAREAYDRRDYVTVLRLIRPLAEQGDAPAQAMLGMMYQDGEGVLQDYTEAAKWYRLAADHGEAPAQYMLGRLYFGGWGVPQDDVQAAKWFRSAADRDYAEAQSSLGFMYANGRGVQKNHVEAAKWFRKAADQGHAEAQAILGSLYGRGEGVPQDYVRAHMWFNLAAAQGYQKAVEARAEVSKTMSAVQIAEAQKLAREWKPTVHADDTNHLDLVDSTKGCRNFDSVDDAILEPFMRWLAGYRDGVAALAVFDKRLGNLPRDPYVLGALVLSSCHAKPDRSIGEVTGEMIEILINQQPGRRLNLAVPKP